jgi:uncharacterized protein (DUF302 family)
LRAGDFIPADARLVAGELSVDQSALTGESLAVDKRPGDLLYSGSVVHRGEATAVVILTGARTYFGRTTELVQRARPKLHVEAVVSGVVGRLFMIVGLLVAGAVVLSVVRGFPLLDILPLALVLLMSAVPVALPVMITVSTAVGSMALGKTGLLVTRHKFGVSSIHDLKATMAKNGVEFSPHCQIFAVCNPTHAKQVLETHIEISTALPCRISAREQGGVMKLATSKPTAMIALYPTPELHGVAQEVEETLVNIMQEAAA